MRALTFFLLRRRCSRRGLRAAALLASVQGYFAVYDIAHIASSSEKLHHFVSRPCQLRPARSRLRILFHPAQRLAFKHKIHFAQMSPGSLSHGKLLTVHVHLRCAFRQGPTANGDQRFLQSHGHPPTASRLSIPIMDGSLTIAGGAIRSFLQMENGIGALGSESAEVIAQSVFWRECCRASSYEAAGKREGDIDL